MDKYKLLTKFAGDLPQAFDIDVVVQHNHLSMKSKTSFGASQHDADIISQRVDGATMFINFLEDYKYEITKKTKIGTRPLPNRERK